MRFYPSTLPAPKNITQPNSASTGSAPSKTRNKHREKVRFPSMRQPESAWSLTRVKKRPIHFPSMRQHWERVVSDPRQKTTHPLPLNAPAWERAVF